MSFLVLGTGLEPVRPLQSLDFKSSVSTNFTTQAVFFDGFNFYKKLIKYAYHPSNIILMVSIFIKN